MEIHWRSPGALAEEDREVAEKKLLQLAEGHQDLIDVWIDVGDDSHHQKGTEHVTVRAQVRRADIVAGGDDIETRLALRNALNTFTRELKRLRDRRAPGPPEPVSGPPLRGVVDRIFLEDGYGFLVGDDGEQVYFHRNALSGGLELEAIREGQNVAFNLEPGEKGPQATVVVPPPPEPV